MKKVSDVQFVGSSAVFDAFCVFFAEFTVKTIRNLVHMAGLLKVDDFASLGVVSAAIVSLHFLHGKGALSDYLRQRI